MYRSTAPAMRRLPLQIATENRTKLFDDKEVRAWRVPAQSEDRREEAQARLPLESERGAGSHGTVYPGERFAMVKDLKKELGPGLLADMREQLGIRKEDL